MNYTLFVDESGDQGLRKVRSKLRSHGASEYLTLGAVLVPDFLLESYRDELRKVSTLIGEKPLHCVDLKHFEVCAFCREVCRLKVCFFGVVSQKSTLGDYKGKIEGDRQAQSYYNKCSHYLLEMVGGFVEQSHSRVDEIAIIFEEKNHDYDRLRNYISTVRAKPMNERAKLLQNIDPAKIVSMKKSEEPLLAIADLVAHGLLQAFSAGPKNYGFPEQRYLRELKHKFWSDPGSGQIADYGINFIKKYEMTMDENEKRFCEKFYVRHE